MRSAGSLLPLASVLPFVLLLLSIAILPLALPHWWERNRNKAIVALILGVPTAAYLATWDPELLIHTAREYSSFIVLLGSLFTISGGLYLTGNLVGTPRTNLGFLGLGAVLANVIGTTGASMVLIRPLLRANSERQHTRHIVVFFIFVVSNCGGLLTPLGDPPLFLGYLRGVPFFWTLRLWPQWLLCLASVLATFLVLERAAFRKETIGDRIADIEDYLPLRLAGRVNLVFLLGVVAAVFLPEPWREIGMIAMAALSLKLGPSGTRAANKFSWGPILEVAILFAGIFVTMVPALEILKARGGELGIVKPWQFFWLTGALSSFLDNAPTYLTFASTAEGAAHAAPAVLADWILAEPRVAGLRLPEILLEAVSCGAVMMGANSYIGNGPNFMVKAIAEESGVKMPSFFGYMLYSAFVLLPTFALITLVFFRG